MNVGTDDTGQDAVFEKPKQVIIKGHLSELVKDGLFFSMESDDRVFTGDLFFDMVSRTFIIRGVPAIGGRRVHCFKAKDKGPYRLHLFLLNVVSCIPQDERGLYVDMVFDRAKCAGEFAAWIEEWHAANNPALIQVMNGQWEFKADLTWIKS
jgi:hypothetical protein